MANPFMKVLNWISNKFSKDASKMLIWTGVAGWTLSSLAQISAVLFNPKLSKEQKSFLIPQELADAAVNIGSFFLVTQLAKKTVAKLFSTGKFAPSKVRKFLAKNKDLYGNKVGKLNFDLDEVLKIDKSFPADEYYGCKNFFTSLATVGAGVLSSNIITPIARNNMASGMQKNFIKAQQKKDIETSVKSPQPLPQTTFKSYGMRI